MCAIILDTINVIDEERRTWTCWGRETRRTRESPTSILSCLLLPFPSKNAKLLPIPRRVSISSFCLRMKTFLFFISHAPRIALRSRLALLPSEVREAHFRPSFQLSSPSSNHGSLPPSLPPRPTCHSILLFFFYLLEVRSLSSLVSFLLQTSELNRLTTRSLDLFRCSELVFGPSLSVLDEMLGSNELRSTEEDSWELGSLRSLLQLARRSVFSPSISRPFVPFCSPPSLPTHLRSLARSSSAT